jgi:hypothetical protein
MIAMQASSVKAFECDSILDMYATIMHMKRMQVQFTDEQARILQERAGDSRRPIAAVVRDAVDAWIAADAQHRRRELALAAIGGFHSGLGDLAEHHDRYLEEEIG